MGEWYDYKLKIKEKNIVNLVEQAGIASVKMLTPPYRPNATPEPRIVFPSKKAIYGNAFLERNIEEEDHEIIIGIEGSDIYYCSKWQPDDTLADYICKNLPNEIVQVDCFAPYYDKDLHWFQKGEQGVNKEGEPVNKKFIIPTHKQIKEKDGIYLISLPIGDKDELWGTISVDPKNIIGDITHGCCVYFSEDIVSVRFKKHTEPLPPEEIVERDRIAKESYREGMRRNVQITDLPPDAFQLKEDDFGNYYVIKIPCENSISANGTLMAACPDYATQPEAGTVCLGPAGKEKNVIVVNEEGHTVGKSMKLAEIEKTWLSTRQPEMIFPQEEEIDR